MATFDFRTGDNKKERTPYGKTRIYFSCHPDDFDIVFPGDELPCFDKVCSDILDKANKDCAIFYAIDRYEPFSDEEIEGTLKSMNLFVIAVSTRLLYSSDRSLQVYQVLDYAKKNDRPVLPILMDVPTSNLLSIYSAPENFGKLQFIDPHNRDTNISYNDCLSNYLEEHIISSEQIANIRSAFTSSIFLSYRKKDRKYAEELMKYVHKELGAFDIAIWYDEFLPIGEDWRINISKAMEDVKEKSNLFMLVVTPSVLELVNGKKNFVVREEYPEACKKGMKILPVELVPTDYSLLSSQVDYSLPTFVSKESEEFKNALISTVEDYSVEKRAYSPEQLYYFGLAYFFGVHVETDSELGLFLLRASAAAGNKDAIDQIFRIASTCHDNGILHVAEELYEQVCEYMIGVYGKYSEEAIRVGMRYWQLQMSLGEKDRLSAVLSDIDDILEHLSEDSPYRTELYINMANVYNLCGKPDEAIRTLRMAERCLDKQCSSNEEDFSMRVKIMATLGDIYAKCGEHQKSLDIRGQMLEKLQEHYDDDHRDVIMIRGHIAGSYNNIGEHTKAAEMCRKVLEVKRKSKYFGPNQLSTVLTMTDVISSLMMCVDVGNAYDEALGLIDEGIEISKCVFCDIGAVELTFHTLAVAIRLKRKPIDEVNAAQIQLHLDRAVELRRSLQMVNTYQEILTNRNYATLYIGFGNVLKGLEVFEEAYLAALKIKNDERCIELAKELSHDLLYQYFSLYEECKKNHNIKKANSYLAKIYETSLHYYGPFHEVTIEFQRRLAESKNKKKGKKKK